MAGFFAIPSRSTRRLAPGQVQESGGCACFFFFVMGDL